MPPPPSHGSKKKKKGHAPAHQNKFAFRHNPKSKTTEKILNSPNVNVCRRCYDKIEWRKQYRKYKPRTQPGTCNGCGKRNVLAAYHTICTKCTKDSVKARQVIDEHITDMLSKTEATTSVSDVELANELQNDVKEEQEQTTSRPQQIQQKNDEQNEEGLQTLRHRSTLRACAVCVKEVALPNPDDDEEDLEDEMMRNLSGGVRKIRLREIKTLERKKQEELDRQREGRRGKKEDGDDRDEGEEDVMGGGTDVEFENHDTVSAGVVEGDNDNEDDDPFLKAVGGSDKLVTGDAYRQKLLLEQQQK